MPFDDLDELKDMDVDVLALPTSSDLNSLDHTSGSLPAGIQRPTALEGVLTPTSDTPRNKRVSLHFSTPTRLGHPNYSQFRTSAGCLRPQIIMKVAKPRAFSTLGSQWNGLGNEEVQPLVEVWKLLAQRTGETPSLGALYPLGLPSDVQLLGKSAHLRRFLRRHLGGDENQYHERRSPKGGTAPERRPDSPRSSTRPVAFTAFKDEARRKMLNDLGQKIEQQDKEISQSSKKGDTARASSDPGPPITVPTEEHSKMVPAEGPSRMMPAEGPSKMVPAEGPSKMVPTEGHSKKVPPLKLPNPKPQGNEGPKDESPRPNHQSGGLSPSSHRLRKWAAKQQTRAATTKQLSGSPDSSKLLSSKDSSSQKWAAEQQSRSATTRQLTDSPDGSKLLWGKDSSSSEKSGQIKFYSPRASRQNSIETPGLLFSKTPSQLQQGDRHTQSPNSKSFRSVQSGHSKDTGSSMGVSSALKRAQQGNGHPMGIKQSEREHQLANQINARKILFPDTQIDPHSFEQPRSSQKDRRSFKDEAPNSARSHGGSHRSLAGSDIKSPRNKSPNQNKAQAHNGSKSPSPQDRAGSPLQKTSSTKNQSTLGRLLSYERRPSYENRPSHDNTGSRRDGQRKSSTFPSRQGTSQDSYRVSSFTGSTDTKKSPSRNSGKTPSPPPFTPPRTPQQRFPQTPSQPLPPKGTKKSKGKKCPGGCCPGMKGCFGNLYSSSRTRKKDAEKSSSRYWEIDP